MTKHSAQQQRGIALSTYIIVIGVALFLGLGLGWVAQDREQHVINATVLPESRPLPDFQLPSIQGRAVSPESLKGQWTWVFFGFTHCPDVCPGTLSALRDTMPLIEGKKPQALFISLDPERDTLDKLGEYVRWFNPSFNAATGDIKALNKAAQSMGIAWNKVFDKNSDNYQIDHTSWVILLNPSAQIQAWFSPPHLPQEMADDFMAIRDNHIPVSQGAASHD